VAPLVVGMMTGHLLGAFLLSVCTRITLVSHSTFCINSVCHTFGKATYDPASSARDHWFVALLTNGEGYHNFHHRFPSDYRNGIRWYHWDPSKWTIQFLAALGLVERLNVSPEDKIQQAKIWAQTQREKPINFF
jgi:stearoyl-CoA desaturase (delta-9 desaturase)